ncbi:MAG: cytochrome c biogenesis protein CcdA [Eggerthellaceae bacterium]|nr:cytochrome c biogenesis protein CcdA [Eggerthellaceae bacterium]
MEYFVSFLEGVITFVSPCLLPMIPIYVTYFAAGEEQSTRTILKNALGFVLGFTIVFVCMGALAGTIGSFFLQYRIVLNIICGLVVIFFGLYFLGFIKINLFKGVDSSLTEKNLGFFSALLFGIVFSIGWTPCVGAFLGSALMLASQQASMVTGIIMLLCYSIGLGIPFVISALLIDKLKGAFDVIKRHYDTINKICGWLLVAIGVLMATGLLGDLLGFLS